MRCAVFGCDVNNNSGNNDNVSFHKFPNEKNICKKWVLSCRRQDQFNIKNARICSNHFKPDNFITPNPILQQYGLKSNVQIKRNVIPSLLLPLQKPIHLITPRFERKQKREMKSSSTVLKNQEITPSASDSPEIHEVYQEESNIFTNKEPTHTIIQDCSTTNSFCQTESTAVCKRDFSTQTDSFTDSYSKLQEEVVHLRKKCWEQQQIIHSVGQIFSEAQLQKLKSEKRVKWAADDIAKAVTLHSAGPRAYRLLLKKKMPFPAVITLKKWCTKVEVYPGILNCVLKLMRTIDMTANEKICILCFDEMKVKEKIVYDKRKDQTLQAAKYVQVAMVRGLIGNSKQPIYYDFDQKMTTNILYEIINSIQDCGFHVAAIVCDLGGTNQGLLRDLNISVKTPFFKNSAERSKNIYVFADVPHLIKLVRNHFVDHGFEIDGELINSQIIEELIMKTNNKSDLSVAYKISAANLKVRGAERQKVKLATKLFSHTVANAIYRAGSLGELTSESWQKCAEFFKQVNDWFDCLSVRQPYKDSRQRVQGVGISESVQFEIVDQVSSVIDKMRVKGKSNLMPFQKGILMTNNSLKLLYADLKSQYCVSYILTYRLNQDVLEIFFGTIRAKGGLYDHPDRLEFMYRLRSYILGRNEGSLSMNGNTMVDDTPDLETVDNLSSMWFRPLVSEISPKEIAKDDELECLQYDGLEHLAGYICHRIKDPKIIVDPCDINTTRDTSFTWTNQLSEGFLKKPTDKMMQEMEKL